MIAWWRVKEKWSMLPPTEDKNAWSTGRGTCCCVQERVFITRKWGSPGKGQGHWMTVSFPEPPYGNANTTTPQLWFLKPSLRTQWRHCGERAYITLAEETRNDTTSATGSVQGEDYIDSWFSHLPGSLLWWIRLATCTCTIIGEGAISLKICKTKIMLLVSHLLLKQV